MKATKEESTVGTGSGSVILWYASTDPDPYQNVTDPEHWYTDFLLQEVEFGIVYNPILDQLWTARKGHGAFYNGSQVQSNRHMECYPVPYHR